MDILVLTFGVPFLMGIVLGVCSKSYLNKVIRKRAFDRHLDELYKEVNHEQTISYNLDRNSLPYMCDRLST